MWQLTMAHPFILDIPTLLGIDIVFPDADALNVLTFV